MIKKENLVEKVMVHDVGNWIHETKSIGFQNKWNVFRKEIKEGDELWSYSKKERFNATQGYAIIRNHQIINIFETTRQ